MKKIILITISFVLAANGGMAQKTNVVKSSINKQQILKNQVFNDSTITTTTTNYTSGTTLDLMLNYHHSTSLYNTWVDGISLTFPSGVMVNSATNSYLNWNEEIGDGVETTWGDMWQCPGNDSLTINTFWMVNITIDINFTNDLIVYFHLVYGGGDIYQTEPFMIGSSFILRETIPTFKNVSPENTLNTTVFPNPANNVITVANAENANITIINMVGAVVSTVNNASANQTIDISTLANGTYFVRVNSEVFKINVVK